MHEERVLMKKPLLALSIIASIASSGFAGAGSEANRFEGVEVSIPVLSHDYYLGKNSGATHYWHGENRDTLTCPGLSYQSLC